MICALQLALATFWASKKSYLFMDELFSYATSNRAEGVAASLPSNEWLDEKWLIDYMSADSEHRFEYSIPYKNQDADVHPPLFYLFLHTASSLIPEEFSYWAGTGCNILFFLGCTITLYFLGKEFLKDKIYSLLVAFLFSVSYGGLNAMAFIRMYMLLALFVLIHTYIYLKYFEEEEIPGKAFLFLGVTVILGTLTQYYFVIIAFFFGVWYGIRFLRKKDYNNLGKYIATAVISAGISVAIYPTMLKHIFRTGRGVEARENLVSLSGYFKDLFTMWRLLDSQLFTNLFVIIFLILIVLFAIYKKQGGTKNIKLSGKTGAILFACAGYFVVVTKIAPYCIDRYLMPIYPLVYMVVIGAMYKLGIRILPVKKVASLCVLGFAGLSVVHMLHSAIPHTYSKDVVITPRLTLAEEYSDTYAIYVRARDEEFPRYYDILQVLSKHKGYYYIDNVRNVEQFKDDMKLLEDEHRVVVYVDVDLSWENDCEMLKKSVLGVKMNTESLLYEDQNWDVYLLEDI